MTAQTLQGRVALVTGGTTGIGFGSARRLLDSSDRQTRADASLATLDSLLLFTKAT